MARTEGANVHLTGQLLAYELKGGKIHGIRLGDASGEYRIKLGGKVRATLLRDSLQQQIHVGDWVKVLVSRRVKLSKPSKSAKSGQGPKLKAKLKVRSIKVIKPPAKPEQQASLKIKLQASWPPDTDNNRKGSKKRSSPGSSCSATDATVKILVCQKSGCCKRGGKAAYKVLTQGVQREGLGDRIQVKATGCLGKCSKGPNLVVDKTRHHHVGPKAAEKLLAMYQQPASSTP